MKTEKLIKVCEGLYRTESGGVTVMRDHSGRRLDKWLVKFKTVFGAEVRKQFSTLAEVRQFINEV